ncbi:putative bicarbonate transporter [Helianthus annuus]|nr:putative bicarbonate transporter [Helianthus annuus]
MKEDTPRFSPAYIMAAVIPTLMISDLYFFEQKDFKLKNPSTYHYDILLLVFMVSFSRIGLVFIGSGWFFCSHHVRDHN